VTATPAVSAGLVLSLAGSFLVSAEALGLDRLRNLERSLSRAEEHLTWPLIVQDDGTILVPRRPWYYSWFLWHAVGAMVLLVPLLFVVTWLTSPWSSLWDMITSHRPWVTLVIIAVCLWVAGVALFYLAEFAVHVVARALVTSGIRVLVWTRGHAGDGAAVRAGLGLLAVGCVLEILG